jgi:hypothetical protein
MMLRTIASDDPTVTSKLRFLGELIASQLPIRPGHRSAEAHSSKRLKKKTAPIQTVSSPPSIFACRSARSRLGSAAPTGAFCKSFNAIQFRQDNHFLCYRNGNCSQLLATCRGFALILAGVYNTTRTQCDV